MSSLLRRLWPRSLAGQLVVSLLATLIAAQIVAFVILTDERQSAVEETTRDQVIGRTVALARLLAETPSSMHEHFVRNASSRRIRFDLTNRGLLERVPETDRDRAIERQLAEELGPLAREVRVSLGAIDNRFLLGPRRMMREHEVTPAETTPSQIVSWIGFTVSLALPTGRWLNMRTLVRPSTPPIAGPALISMAVLAIAMVLIVVFTVRRMTRPLRALAGAAERLGRGEAVNPLEEAGPSDVRQTVAAFNAMQDRLKRFVDDRTRMLAAVSHDLRTPITALRLRAEMVEDEETREAMKATLAEMQSMVEGTLAFARDEAAQEETRTVDLAALVDSLVDDLAAMGKDVAFADSGKLPLACRSNALRRALRNLIDNAVAYGVRARVRLVRRGEAAIIEVDDDGPGIPDADLGRVFEPFVRLEASRSKDTGGIGLGLSIARTIVRAHGGDIVLINRPDGGLRASVILPIAPVV